MNNINLDPAEIAKFSALAAQWWDTQGSSKPLHAINPLRMQFISQHTPLIQQKIIDIGCGGGILTEALAKQGAIVTGIDMSEAALNVAKLHQLETGCDIEYLHITAENIALQRKQQYDVVTCLEMLEHVPDPSSVIRAAAELVKPGGHVFFSTLNRTFKAYLFAIIGAEYVMQLLPTQTHDYSKFIRPSELGCWSRDAGLEVKDMVGITYNPFTKSYKLTQDVAVNYLVYCQKKG